MTEIENKVAFVTGAASGIGYALCEALVKRGAKVMLSDIDGPGLERAVETLGAPDQTASVLCDVAKAKDLHNAVKATLDAFGKVHLIFNNAGVSLGGRPGKIALEDWKWIVDINVMGVIYGCEAFIPTLIEQGEGGHVINTASMAGHSTDIGMSPYFTTKFAVVGYSEALSKELAAVGIGVSCLCPTWVKSNIHNTTEKAPVAGKYVEVIRTSKHYQAVKELIENGMDAEVYAELCLDAVEKNRLHVFNDPDARQAVVERNKQLLNDYDENLKVLGLE
ncbi:SDR family NAD(P)-dependent oxidoreductase [Litorimonas haliclonae]|uniref:SDR family NAD(P)-dependent oxidoreductase n=1 Tax=Litorimonas haliclonae TaxID=2081977 RepID=UPI0039F019A0